VTDNLFPLLGILSFETRVGGKICIMKLPSLFHFEIFEFSAFGTRVGPHGQKIIPNSASYKCILRCVIHSCVSSA
jgi:hypothetical protein